MSRLSDYGKFDNLVDSDDEDDNARSPELQRQQQQSQHPQQQQQPQQQPQPWHNAGAITRKDESTGRFVFECGGQKVYEWEQTLDEVTMYVEPPPGTKAAQMMVQIQTRHLKVGMKGHDRFYLDEDTYGQVDTSESSWYMGDDGIVHIVLIKAHKAETWESALRGLEASVDPFLKTEIQKDLLLERFQEEHPGMDFRGADFNGQVPNPRTFMGGIKYD